MYRDYRPIISLLSGAFFASLFVFGLLAGVELLRKNYLDEHGISWSYFGVPFVLLLFWFITDYFGRKSQRTLAMETGHPELLKERQFGMLKALFGWLIVASALIRELAYYPWPFDPTRGTEAYEVLNNLYRFLFFTGMVAIPLGLDAALSYLLTLDEQRADSAAGVIGPATDAAARAREAAGKAI